MVHSSCHTFATANDDIMNVMAGCVKYDVIAATSFLNWLDVGLDVV